MRNTEIKVPDDLLYPNGELKNPSWSRSLLQKYDKSMIKAHKMRIKEWDYYLILNDDFALALTVSDLAYLGMVSVSFIDFKTPKYITKTTVIPMTLGKMNLPASSKSGDIKFLNKNVFLSIENKNGRRKLICSYKNFSGDKSLYCNINLTEPEMDSMVIATPWKEDKKAFYYNQKINLMPASGSVFIADKSYKFSEKNSFGTLDWGRGVWTRDNTWLWGSGNKVIDGKDFGFNIGYGFGDTGAATENTIFYEGKAHKIDEVAIYLDRTDYLKPWYVRSSDDRFEVKFKPIIDRKDLTNIGVLITDQHQVFGKLSGKAVLDDGKVIEIEDMTCFIEEVRNKY